MCHLFRKRLTDTFFHCGGVGNRTSAIVRVHRVNIPSDSPAESAEWVTDCSKARCVRGREVDGERERGLTLISAVEYVTTLGEIIFCERWWRSSEVLKLFLGLAGREPVRGYCWVQTSYYWPGKYLTRSGYFRSHLYQDQGVQFPTQNNPA